MSECNEKPVKVLHYIKHLNSGGGEMFLYNLLKNIDNEKVQFDFLVNTSAEEILTNEVKSRGANVIPLMKDEPRFVLIKIINVIKSFKNIFKNSDYSIVHIHCSNSQGLLFCYVLSKLNIQNRIVHIHNSGIDGRFIFVKKIVHNVMKYIFANAPTHYIACSSDAANWLYCNKILNNKKVLLLKNGIDTDKFSFDESARSKIRKNLSINNEIVLISVGRFEKEKNHIMLLKVFKKILATSINYRLILIGRGSQKEILQKFINENNINSYVNLIEFTDRVEDYLNAADIFILPSIKEGLGIAAIEAQACGLKTVVSDGIPKEAYITDLISSISLSEEPEQWAKKIIEIKPINNRFVYSNIVAQRGYDIKSSADKLMKLYLYDCIGEIDNED